MAFGPAHPATPTNFPTPLNIGPVNPVGTATPLQARTYIKSLTAAQAVLGTAAAMHAAVADTGAPITVATAITQPLFARNVTFTPSGTAANVTAVQMVVTGTDLSGATITETLPAFTATALTAVTGVKAFATITSYVQPACGAGVSISGGFGAKIGLDFKLARNTLDYAFLNFVKEGTAPTVTVDAVNLANNTATLNSALNGTQVDIYYRTP